MAIELEQMMVVEFLNDDDDVIENRLLVMENDDDDVIENLSFDVDRLSLLLVVVVVVVKDFSEAYLLYHFPYV